MNALVPATTLGFGRRIALAFAALAAILVAVGWRVSVQVSGMHLQVKRVVEEQREAGFARDLVHALELAGHGEQDKPGSVDDHLDVAATALEALIRGPEGDDPSTPEHQSEEDRAFEAIRADMAAVREQVARSDHPPLDSVELERARRAAEGVRDMILAESRSESRDLNNAASNMRSEVLWTNAAAFLVIVGVLWMVRRFVVRPVEELREGAGLIAAGDLTHRVRVSSRDEIGDLAIEFNRMADELLAARRELERRVEERTQEFLRAARLAGLGTMAAGIAHEINNPVASIASCAEGLERRLSKGTLDSEQLREYLQIIAKEAYRTHEITSRLLEFACNEQGASVPFSMRELLREIEVLLEYRLRARDLVLQSSCDPALPSLQGDPTECKQVLLNLIHNAIDASPAGGVVSIVCRREGEQVCIEVEDQGPGIRPEHMERIFDPFFTTKAPGKGTGLGLAIVHRIVEHSGGRILVQNSERGALFRVLMPIATTEPG